MEKVLGKDNFLGGGKLYANHESEGRDYQKKGWCNSERKVKKEGRPTIKYLGNLSSIGKTRNREN